MSRNTEVSLRLTENAKKIYDKLPAKGKGIWVSEAIEEKHDREKGIIFTPEQIEYLNKYYIRKDDIK